MSDPSRAEACEFRGGSFGGGVGALDKSCSELFAVSVMGCERLFVLLISGNRYFCVSSPTVSGVSSCSESDGTTLSLVLIIEEWSLSKLGSGSRSIAGTLSPVS